MGTSGRWVMGALDDRLVSEVAPVVAPVIGQMRQSDVARAAWARWEREVARGGGAVRVRREDSCYSTDEALHLHNMVDASPFHALETSGTFDVMELWGRFDDAVEPHAAGAHKDSPVAAAFHGLGPGRARLLPGWVGDALLSSAQVREHLGAVESALCLYGAEREQALGRINDWTGDTSCSDVLDHLLRVWRQAAASGLGLLSSELWI